MHRCKQISKWDVTSSNWTHFKGTVIVREFYRGQDEKSFSEIRGPKTGLPLSPLDHSAALDDVSVAHGTPLRCGLFMEIGELVTIQLNERSASDW